MPLQRKNIYKYTPDDKARMERDGHLTFRASGFRTPGELTGSQCQATLRSALKHSLSCVSGKTSSVEGPWYHPGP